MLIDCNPMELIKYINTLQDKINTLESLVKLRDSEIEKYRECLKEIGAQLNVEREEKQPIYFGDWSSPVPCKITVKRVHVYFDRTFAVSGYLEEKLKKINEVLEEYGDSKNE